MTNKFAGIEGINQRLFRVIYSKGSDKVYISYNGERLMTVTNVSDKYYTERLNGLQIGELVLDDNFIEILNMLLGDTPTEEVMEEAEEVVTTKANEIDFEIGMEFTSLVVSPYGKEYNEVKRYKVISIRNYKARGQKISIKDLDYGYMSSLWKNEYPHDIEITVDNPAPEGKPVIPMYIENTSSLIN